MAARQRPLLHPSSLRSLWTKQQIYMVHWPYSGHIWPKAPPWTIHFLSRSRPPSSTSVEEGVSGEAQGKISIINVLKQRQDFLGSTHSDYSDTQVTTYFLTVEHWLGTSFQQEHSFGNGTQQKAILWFSSGSQAQTVAQKHTELLKTSTAALTLHSHLWRLDILLRGFPPHPSDSYPLLTSLEWRTTWGWMRESKCLSWAEDVCQHGGCRWTCSLCLEWAGTAWVWIRVECQQCFCLLESNRKLHAEEYETSKCGSEEEVVSKLAQEQWLAIPCCVLPFS